MNHAIRATSSMDFVQLHLADRLNLTGVIGLNVFHTN